MPEDIGLKITVDDKQAQAALKKLDKSLDDIGDSTEDLSEAAQKSGKSMDDLSDDMLSSARSSVDLAAKMYIVQQAMDEVKQLASQGLELAKLGATAERIEDRFGKFAAEIGGAEAALDAFQVGADGAASKMEAMQSASMLLQMDLVNSTDEMEEMVTVAVRLGDQTQSVTERTENFALMMANQSLPRLDSYGISSGWVRKRIIELTDATEGLTREQAFSQAVMEAGADQLAVLGPRVDDAAKSFEVIEAQMADARVELGQKLAPVFAGAIDMFGDLGNEAMMLVTVLGEFGGTLVKLGPALPMIAGGAVKMAKAMKSVNLISLATNPVLLALAVTVGALVAVYKTWDTQNKKVAKSAQEALDAADKTAESIGKLVDKGHDVTMVFKDYGKAANDAASAWNSNIATSTALGGVFGTQAKIMRVIKERHAEVQQAAVAQTGSYQEAIKLIDHYNAQVTDASWRITGFTKTQYDLIQSMEDFRGPAASVTDDLMFFGRIFQEGEFEAWGFGEAMRELSGTVEDVGIGAEDSESRFRHLTRAIEDGTLITDDAEAAQKRLITELENQAEAAEIAEQAEEELQIQLRELAKAHAEAEKAAFNHAAQLLTTAERLSDTADAETIARQALQNLTALEQAGKIGRDEFLAQYRAIQDQFGFVDQGGRDATSAMELLDQKFAAGEITGGQYTDMTVLLAEAVDKGKLNLGLFKEQVDLLPTPTETAASKIEAMKTQIEESGDPTGTLEKALSRMTDETDRGIQPTEDLTQRQKDEKEILENLPDPLKDVQEATELLTEKIIETQEPIDELIERGKQIPTDFMIIAEDMYKAGQALVNRLRDGMNEAWRTLEKDKQELLNAFAEEFHSSPEPKDTASPLRGFAQKGAALVETYFDGMIDEWYHQMGAHRSRLLDLARSFTSLGGAASGILNVGQRELRDQMRGVDDEMKQLADIWGVRGRGRGEDLYKSIIKGLAEQTGSRGVLNPEQFFRRIMVGDYDVRGYENLSPQLKAALEKYKRINALINERNATEKEYLAMQEKLARLQEAQRRMRFLEQQISLLKMIKEQGLDAQQFLGGMKLGAEADAEEILRITTEVLEAIIGKVSSELEIGSPSKVFRRFGQSMMEGMAFGIADMAALPVRGSLIATRGTMAGPAVAGGRSYSNVNNSRSVTVNAGGNQFNSGMDEAAYSNRTTRAVSRALRGW